MSSVSGPLLREVPYWEGVADVVLDMRFQPDGGQESAVEIVATHPALRIATNEFWDVSLTTSEGAVAVHVRAYGVRAVREDSGTLVLCFVEPSGRVTLILADVAAGKPALAWAEEVAPYLVEVLRMGTGTGHGPRATRSVGAMLEAVHDPRAWIGDWARYSASETFKDWDATGDPLAHRTNWETMLCWSATGVRKLRTAAAFAAHLWTPEVAYRLSMIDRVENLEEAAAVVRAVARWAGMSAVSINRVAPVLSEMHAEGFTATQVTEWLESPLGQWFFNQTSLVAELLGRGWTRKALLLLAARVHRLGSGRMVAIEMVLWEEIAAGQGTPVGLFVEAGVARSEVAALGAAGVTEAQLEMLAGLNPEPVPAQAPQLMPVTAKPARVPLEYPRD